MRNGECNMKKISKAVFESRDACDTKVTIDLSHVECIKEDELVITRTPGTTIYFTSGREVFVEEKYDSVRDMLEEYHIQLKG